MANDSGKRNEEFLCLKGGVREVKTAKLSRRRHVLSIYRVTL